MVHQSLVHDDIQDDPGKVVNRHTRSVVHGTQTLSVALHGYLYRQLPSAKRPSKPTTKLPALRHLLSSVVFLQHDHALQFTNQRLGVFLIRYLQSDITTVFKRYAKHQCIRPRGVHGLELV